jgi:hypothetical protein
MTDEIEDGTVEVRNVSSETRVTGFTTSRYRPVPLKVGAQGALHRLVAGLTGKAVS